MSAAEDPLTLIQQAVFERLDADVQATGVSGSLGALGVVGVFDYVEEGTPRPYIMIGETITTPDNRHGGFGRQVVIMPHIWTEERGFKVAIAILNRMVQLLDHQPLDIGAEAPQRAIEVRFEFSQTLIDPEPPGDLRHIPTRFRVVTEQTT